MLQTAVTAQQSPPKGQEPLSQSVACLNHEILINMLKEKLSGFTEATKINISQDTA